MDGDFLFGRQARRELKRVREEDVHAGGCPMDECGKSRFLGGEYVQAQDLAL
jgi:hypothetical protein